MLSAIFCKERFTKKDWAYSLLVLFGVFLVMDIDFGSLELANKGNIYFVLSALFVSINAFVIKSVQTDKENPVQDNVVVFYNNFITLILFMISMAVMGTTDQIMGIGSDRGLLLAVSCAGSGQTLVYIVYYYNLRNHPVWIVKVFLLLMPIVSMLVSLLLFGSTIKAIQCLGVGVVLLGALGILLEQASKGRIKKERKTHSFPPFFLNYPPIPYLKVVYPIYDITRYIQLSILLNTARYIHTIFANYQYCALYIQMI